MTPTRAKNVGKYVCYQGHDYSIAWAGVLTGRRNISKENISVLTHCLMLAAAEEKESLMRMIDMRSLNKRIDMRSLNKRMSDVSTK